MGKRVTGKQASEVLLSYGLVAIAFCCHTAGSYLSYTSCSFHFQCPSSKFCAQFLGGQALGTCQGCWQCCLFPNLYGATACESRCRCSTSAPCYLDADCGPGNFCAVLQSRSELPVCQPCQLCRNDSQAWSGSCADACPSGALDGNGVPQGVEGHYVFAAFDIANHPLAKTGLHTSKTEGAMVTVAEDALRLWLGDLPAHVLGALLPPPPPPQPQAARRARTQGLEPTPVTPGADVRAVPLGVFAARLAAILPKPDPLCPHPDQPQPGLLLADFKPTSRQPNSGSAAFEVVPAAAAKAEPADTTATTAAIAVVTTNTVPASCPCNPAAEATSFRCPGGQRCSPRAWLPLPADVVTLGGTALLKARCVDCEPGTYCPEGTFVEERDDVMASLDCPAGRFCPSPSQGYTCPAGYFCPSRSTSPTTCNYDQLLQNSTTASSPLVHGALPPREVIRLLLGDREPVRGNYCPSGSTLPNRRCRPGYYCPEPYLELLCPPGHFCRAANVAPSRCPPLTLCEAGAAAPRVWPAAVAAFSGILAATVLCAALLRSVDRSKDLPETDQERRSRAERALRDLVSYLNRRPVTAACPELAAIQRYHLAVEDLTWRANGQPHGHLVLNGVSGRFLAGHLSAILGPSGCGKSSLLSLLAGRALRGGSSRGKLTLRNVGADDGGCNTQQREIRDGRDICYVVGFVPQDDIVCADLTIRENLEYSAALRLPMRTERKGPPWSQGAYEDGKGPGDRKPAAMGWDRLPRSLRAPMAISNPEEQRKVVNEVLGMMALRTAQSYRVGSVDARIISGGQRKRVNIGVELVSRPPLLFLDEPTSGLDASCSNVVLRSLLGLAVNGGVNVVAVIHQPRHSVFNMFHEIHLLGEGGSTVYHGPPGKAQVYFQDLLYFFPPYENVADTLLDIVTGKIVNKSCLTKDLPRIWKQRLVSAATDSTTAPIPIGSPPNSRTATAPPSPIPATNPGAASPYLPSSISESPFCNISWCKGPDVQQSSGSPNDVASASGDGVSSSIGGKGNGSDIYRPEFTEDIKDILEAEFDRIVRSAKLPHGASATWRAWTSSGKPAAMAMNGAAALSRSSTLRPAMTHNHLTQAQASALNTRASAISTTTAAAVSSGGGSTASEGLTLDQLRHLFIKLGQEDEDAELLTGLIAQQVHHAEQAPDLPQELSYPGREASALAPAAPTAVTVVSKALLIDTLLRVAQGDLRVSSPEELRAQAAAAAATASAVAVQEERQVLRRMASAASSSLEVLTHKLRHVASNIFHRNGLSHSASLMGTSSLDHHNHSILLRGPRAGVHPGGTLSQSPLDTRESVGSSVMSVMTGMTGRTRVSLSNVTLLFSRLLNPNTSRGPTPLARNGSNASVASVTYGTATAAAPAAHGDGSVSAATATATVTASGGGGLAPSADIAGRVLNGGSLALLSRNQQVEVAIAAATLRFQLAKAHASSFRSPAAGFGVAPGLVANTIREGEDGEEEGAFARVPRRVESVRGSSAHGNAGDSSDTSGEAGGLPTWEWIRRAGTRDGGGGGSSQALQNTKGAPRAAWQRVFRRLRSVRFAPAAILSAPEAAAGTAAAAEDASAVDVFAVTASRGGSGGGGGGDGGGNTTVLNIRRFQQALSATSVIVIGSPDDVAPITAFNVPPAMPYCEDAVLGEVRDGVPQTRGSTDKGSEAVGGSSLSAGAAAATSKHGVRAFSNGSPAASLKEGDSAKDASALQAASYSNTGWLSHLWIFLRRAAVQASRAFWPVTVLEVVLLLAASAAIGATQGSKWGPTAVPGNIIMAMMCLAVLAAVQHLRAFTTNRLMLRRERGAGLSPTAYFIARCLVDLPWILVAPAIFTLPYFILTVPQAPFALYYAISVGVWWWASGLAYLLSDSPLVPSAAAPMAAVLVTLIAGALLNGFGTPSLAMARGTAAAPLLGVSYNRWAVEALTVSELDHYMVTHRNVIAVMYRDKGICGLDKEFPGDDLLHPDGDLSEDMTLALLRLSAGFTRGYCQRAFEDALLALLCLGLGLRLLAMLALKYDAVITQCRDSVVHWWRTLTGRSGSGSVLVEQKNDAMAAAAAATRPGGSSAPVVADLMKGEVSILMDPEGAPPGKGWPFHRHRQQPRQQQPQLQLKQLLLRQRQLSCRRPSSLPSKRLYGTPAAAAASPSLMLTAATSSSQLSQQSSVSTSSCGLPQTARTRSSRSGLVLELRSSLSSASSMEKDVILEPPNALAAEVVANIQPTPPAVAAKMTATVAM